MTLLSGAELSKGPRVIEVPMSPPPIGSRRKRREVQCIMLLTVRLRATGLIGRVWGYQPCTHFPLEVGPNTINQASDNPARPLASGTNPPQDPEPEQTVVNCEVSGRTFNTARGLGVHRRHAYPAAQDALQARIDVKTRWSEEEVQLMARKEAQIQNPLQSMNMALREALRARTLVAIKGKRRGQAYKNLVERYVADFTTRGIPDIQPSAPVQRLPIPPQIPPPGVTAPST